MNKIVVILGIVFVLCILLLVMPSAATNVTAMVSPSTIAQGEKIFINGTAEGQPPFVAIWILGKNFAFKNTGNVNVDGSFSYELKQEATTSLYSGQYFVVVQHPGMNGLPDIGWLGEYVYDFSGTTYVSLFKISGPGSLQGFDAVEALEQGINQPYIDDTSTALQFQIVSPSKIGTYNPDLSIWYLDYNGNGLWEPGTDKVYMWGAHGYQPVTGNWDGSVDGKVKIGTYNPDLSIWYLDYNGNGIWEPGTDKVYTWGAPGYQPVTGDWNGDGKVKIGTYNPDLSIWYLDYNGNGLWEPGTDKVYRWGAHGYAPVVGKWS
jgi:hypothetical protein